MNGPINPRPAWSPPNETAYHLEDSEDIENIARELIDGHHPGVLTTVDEKGHPHCRWMATTSFEEFPAIYSLTAPKSRKLAQIAKNPAVSWMFSNADLSIVVTLTGKADLITDTATTKRIWAAIADKSHAYFLNNFTERPGVAVIRTMVEQIECCLPQSSLRWEAQSFRRS